MGIFNKFFKSKNIELFPELKPNDRIRKIMEENILPDLEKLGFKMEKSSLTISRENKNFRQEIYFSKNKYNSGNDIVKFDILLDVSYPRYKKWHLNQYGFEPLNIGIRGSRVSYIKNWTKDYYNDSWYNLAEDDNLKIVQTIKSNILNAGMNFFNQYADKQKVIDSILDSNMFYSLAPLIFDFAFMLNKKTEAEKILDWFENYKSKEADGFFQDETIKDIEIRKDLLEKW